MPRMMSRVAMTDRRRTGLWFAAAYIITHFDLRLGVAEPGPPAWILVITLRWLRRRIENEDAISA